MTLISFSDIESKIIKFRDGYIIELNKDEWDEVKSKILTSPPLGGGKVKTPNAFTEKGLYMLATILKSKQAVETTIAIIETYSKLRDLTKNIQALSAITNETQKKNTLQKTGEMMTELLENQSFSNASETTIELNFAVVKLKHTIKKNK